MASKARRQATTPEERKAVYRAEYEARRAKAAREGRSTTAARGHARTPSSPAQAIRNPRPEWVDYFTRNRAALAQRFGNANVATAAAKAQVLKDAADRGKHWTPQQVTVRPAAGGDAPDIAADPDNFRATFSSVDEAEAYAATIGVPEYIYVLAVTTPGWSEPQGWLYVRDSDQRSDAYKARRREKDRARRAARRANDRRPGRGR